MRDTASRLVCTHTSFPIPMRGNESKLSAAFDRFRDAFPIPMRGNECQSLALASVAISAFPIPMRGNELEARGVQRSVNACFQSP